MKKVYFTHIEKDFDRALAAIFEKEGYRVVTEAEDNIDVFIDTTDTFVAADNKAVGEGIEIEAAAEAYRKNVCEPLMKLEEVLPRMTGCKRICFLNGSYASVNACEATSGYGHNMAKAALNQIMTITKNGLIEKGYTFRLFDPMDGRIEAEKAAACAYVYFTRDRFHDGPDNRFRQDERNLVVRDALGREIPW